MNWEFVYLLCFGLGLVFSILAVLSGGDLHLHFHGHLPVGHGAGLSHGHSGLGHHSGAVSEPSFWNGFTITAFLCWFGGTGFLLTKYGGFVVSVVFLLALLGGLAGGGFVFLFLARVVAPHEHELTAEETAMLGVVARVSAAIRPEGVGEIVFSQLGALRSAPARSESGQTIAKDEEVYVLRYESGIAYVSRWEDLPINNFERSK